MDEKVLAYAKRVVAFKKRGGPYYPGGVKSSDFPFVRKECMRYLSLVERIGTVTDWRERSIMNYKCECIENRLSEYAYPTGKRDFRRPGTNKFNV